MWDDIDDHMDQRRRVTREKRLKEELEEMRKKNPKITETFADLKRELAETMTQADWEVSCSLRELMPLLTFSERLPSISPRQITAVYACPTETC